VEERTQTFKWFSDLGYLDAKGRKFVRVSTGDWYQANKDAPRNSYVLGFLLRDKEGGFTVHTLSLLEKTYIKTPADVPDHEQVRFEAKDLATVAAAHLKSLRAPESDENRDERPHEILLHRRTETFVLAWACWRNGLDDLSADLFDEAAKMPTGYGFNAHDPPTERLQKLVADDIAHTEMWRTVVACGEPSVSRKRLLERFERIVKHFPESEHHERAKQYAATLHEMIKEDVEHAKNALKPWDKLGKEEQIAVLIFQLREQNGHQVSDPGGCDIFDDFLDFDEKPKKASPAHRLVEFGNDAIPQLIAALEDTRLSRSVECHRSYFFSHDVLRIGDCAAQVLHRITDWDFGEHPVYTGKAAGSRAKAEAWWKEFQEKGEKRMLIEATEKGDLNGIRRAERLVEKYPDAALPALAAGAHNAGDDWDRCHFVYLAGRLKGEQKIGFLREELQGPFQRSRVAAAEALLEADDVEGANAMIREWNDIWRAGGPDAFSKASGLIHFLVELVGRGNREAIDALAAHFRAGPVEIRADIVWAFRREQSFADKNAASDVRDAADMLLIDALDDADVRRGMSIGSSKGSIDDPRVCDLAAGALVDRWGRPDLFELWGSPRNRDRQILELKNIWLKKVGKDPLPLPSSRKPSPAPEKRVAPLLDEVRAAKTHDERRHALKTLDALGLPALPAVREALADLPADHRARADLAALATHLAFRIHEVRFTHDSPEPGEKLRDRFTAFRNKNLSDQDFLDLLVGVVQEFPADAQGVRIAFERPGDDSGASLLVTLLTGQQKGYNWRSDQQIFIDNKRIHHSRDSTDKIGFALTKPEKEWAEFAKKLKDALQSAAGKDISVLVEITRRE
jgi:hypothetical protein